MARAATSPVSTPPLPASEGAGTITIAVAAKLLMVTPEWSKLRTAANEIESGRILFAGEDLIRREAHRIARLGVARTYQIPRPFPSFTGKRAIGWSSWDWPSDPRRCPQS